MIKSGVKSMLIIRERDAFREELRIFSTKSSIVKSQLKLSVIEFSEGETKSIAPASTRAERKGISGAV